MVQRLEIELRQRGLAVRYFQVRLIIHADRGVRVREVEFRWIESSSTAMASSSACKDWVFSRSCRPSSFRASRSAGSFLADRLGNLVRFAIEFLDLDLQEPVRFFELHEPMHVNRARLMQFCLTSSAFSTMNRRSSIDEWLVASG